MINSDFYVRLFLLEMWSRACRGGGGGRGGNTFFKFVGILTKCVGKISRPNAISIFGVF